MEKPEKPNPVAQDFVVEAAAEGERLDRWLAGQLGGSASRTLVQRWIDSGHVRLVSDTSDALEDPAPRLTPRRKVLGGENYHLQVPDPEPQKLEPIDLQLEVLYEDADCAIIRKPPGIAVHPGPGDSQVTIAHGILHLFGPRLLDPGAADPRLALRPGIVHRLDKDTEGLLLVAQHDRARRELMQLFASRSVRKEYLAIVSGQLPRESGRIELALRRHPRERLRMQVHSEGRMAITEFEVQHAWTGGRTDRKYLRVHVELLTGRTHQIRVHLAHLGAAVVGDRLYSRRAADYNEESVGMLLCARRLAFQQPLSGATIDVELPLPDRFANFEEQARRY